MNRVFVTDKAAVGAEQTLLRADGSAGNAFATLGEAADPSEAQEDAEKFLRIEVVTWMKTLEAEGPSLPEALEAALARLGTPEGLVQAFKDKVPWTSCVNFQTVPTHSKTKGALHISMLSYSPCSYAAKGMFVGDAKVIAGKRGICWSRSKGITSETPCRGEHDMLWMGTWRGGGE